MGDCDGAVMIIYAHLESVRTMTANSVELWLRVFVDEVGERAAQGRHVDVVTRSS